MVKTSPQQKPIRLLQQSDVMDSERKKPGRKPTKQIQLDQQPLNGQHALDAQPKPIQVKKIRGRKSKIVIRNPVLIRDESNQDIEVEEPEEVSSYSDTDKIKHEPDILSRFNKLGETIVEFRQRTMREVDQFKKNLKSQFNVSAKTDMPDRLLVSFRNIIAEEVSYQMESQFDSLKEFFMDFKFKRISKEKDRTRGRVSCSDEKSRKSSQEEPMPQSSPKKRGRKKKSDAKISGDALVLDNVVSLDHETAEKAFRSPKAFNFTFRNLHDNGEKPDTPKGSKDIESSPKSRVSLDNKVDKKEKPVESHIINSDIQIRLLGTETDNSDQEEELDKEEVEVEVQVSSEAEASTPQDQMEEVKSIHTQHEKGHSIKTGQDFETEFDLNAFSLNN